MRKTKLIHAFTAFFIMKYSVMTELGRDAYGQKKDSCLLNSLHTKKIIFMRA